MKILKSLNTTYFFVWICFEFYDSWRFLVDSLMLSNENELKMAIWAKAVTVFENEENWRHNLKARSQELFCTNFKDAADDHT